MIDIEGCKEDVINVKQADIITLMLPNKPEYVILARLTVSGIASRMGFDMEVVEDIKLAVAEACTNAIKHGSSDNCSTYKVKIIVEKKHITICVSDRGCGFHPQKVSCYDSDGLREGGMGLFIIKTLMDEVKIENIPDAGCALRMRKYLEE